MEQSTVKFYSVMSEQVQRMLKEASEIHEGKVRAAYEADENPYFIPPTYLVLTEKDHISFAYYIRHHVRYPTTALPNYVGQWILIQEEEHHDDSHGEVVGVALMPKPVLLDSEDTLVNHNE